MLIMLILATIFVSPWQTPLRVTVHPQVVYVEKGATNQFLNFDFMLENPTDGRLQLELIRMSAFDEEGRLLRRLRVDRNAVSPSMHTLPKAVGRCSSSIRFTPSTPTSSLRSCATSSSLHQRMARPCTPKPR